MIAVITGNLEVFNDAIRQLKGEGVKARILNGKATKGVEV